MELLTVIGIVGLLIALLLPALVRARRRMNAVACSSNLRQWAVATVLYANESHGYLPRRGQGVGATSIVNRPTDWFNALPPEFRSPAYADLAAAGRVNRPPGSSVWLCPAADDLAGTNYWSYAMNMGLSVWEANQNNGQPDKITGVGPASAMVLLADAPGNYCSVFPSIIAGGYNPVARHDGRVNLAFLDTHVSAVPAAYIGIGTGLLEHEDCRWHPPGNTWNSAH